MSGSTESLKPGTAPEPEIPEQPEATPEPEQSTV